MINDSERAAFEAGIKLGALYHQWVGTPVSIETAEYIEAAIENSVKLQPGVKKITARIDRSLIQPNSYGYSEIAGTMLDIVVETEIGGANCKAKLKKVDDYPLMEIIEIGR